MNYRPLPERFADKWCPEPNTGCWLWTAAVDAKGYGIIAAERASKARLAHRVSWELHRGVIPDGLYVLHRCDTPACVNPEHLFVGTDADNTADMFSKGRAWQQRVTHCPKGHEYGGENLRRGWRGERLCVTCRRESDRLLKRERYQRLTAENRELRDKLAVLR